MEKKKMMHIGICEGDVGRYVFLPGSPERTEKIAKYFENPKEIAYNREFRTWTGTLDGTPVAVTSTGVGGPSAAIAIEELHQCGVDTMMRVGSCASVSPKVSIGDIVIAYISDVSSMTEAELGTYMLGIQHQTEEQIKEALHEAEQ